MKLKQISLAAASVLLALAVNSSCQKTPEPDTLTVEPSKALTFEATDQQVVDLTVITNVANWSFETPEWVNATKEQSKSAAPASDKLYVSVTENTSSEERVGRIAIKAGSAKTVYVSVLQKGVASSEVEVGKGVAVQLVSKDESTSLTSKNNSALTATLAVSLPAPAEMDVEVKLVYDESYISEYNYLNNVEYAVFPPEKVTLPEGTVKIAKGETESAPIEVLLDPSTIEYATNYLIPFYLESVKGAEVSQAVCRVNYDLIKVNPRQVKNVVYLEVNDVNPLNVLEYKLDDGTPFFDAAILFAANINYDSRNDVVYLHNNPNVTALLENTETYLQPLRKAGIKVYLGLLGNHDAAGLAQLSDWGAKEWAKEVAEACRVYKLDGVNLDDEYSGYPDLSNKWFATPSAAAGSRLMYELKVAMKDACPWPTEVSYFAWGSLYKATNVVGEDGVTYEPKDFVDFYVANYGGSTSPYGGLTMANCSGASIQLNYGQTISEDQAKSIKENGYGWIMWFAFDPSGTGGIPSNRAHSVQQFNKVAKGCYGQSLVNPTGVYNKIGEGKYDPKRYDI